MRLAVCVCKRMSDVTDPTNYCTAVATQEDFLCDECRDFSVGYKGVHFSPHGGGAHKSCVITDFSIGPGDGIRMRFQ